MAPSITYSLRPPLAPILLAVGLFGGAAVLFAALAITGNTDVANLRDLPLSQGGKVAVLWGMSLLSLGFPALAVTKLRAWLSPPELVLRDQELVVPHGLGLRKTHTLTPQELRGCAVASFGSKEVLHIWWTGGKAYLPRPWFAEGEFTAALKAVQALLPERPTGGSR